MLSIHTQTILPPATNIVWRLIVKIDRLIRLGHWRAESTKKERHTNQNKNKSVYSVKSIECQTKGKQWWQQKSKQCNNAQLVSISSMATVTLPQNDHLNGSSLWC